MAVTGKIDLQAIDDAHSDVHKRLTNWAAWASPRTSGGYGSVSPMFRLYRSKAFQWHPPQFRETVDIQDALVVEKCMRHLPYELREALIWFYLVRCTPSIAFRHLGVGERGLAVYLRDGRAMVKNLLH